MVNRLTSLPFLRTHIERRPILYGETMIINLGVQVDKFKVMAKCRGHVFTNIISGQVSVRAW